MRAIAVTAVTDSVRGFIIEKYIRTAAGICTCATVRATFRADIANSLRTVPNSRSTHDN